MPPAATGLPEGFPVDDVPLIGGRLVSATPDAWVERRGVERRRSPSTGTTPRWRPSGCSATTWSTGSALAPPPGVTFPVAGWEVGVAPSTSEDGEPTVAYTILPD